MKRNSAKALCLMLALVLLLAALIPAFAEEKEKRYAKGAFRVVVKVPGERLNVHETPEGGRENVIDRLKEGTVVLVYESVKGWLAIEYWKDHDCFGEGYVDKSYLVPVDADPTVMYTCVDNNYVHSIPCMHEGECVYYHIDKLIAGSPVYVKEQVRSWSYIIYDGKTGWVASKYLIKY